MRINVSSATMQSGQMAPALQAFLSLENSRTRIWLDSLQVEELLQGGTIRTFHDLYSAFSPSEQASQSQTAPDG
jgi:hypothetical protein